MHETLVHHVGIKFELQVSKALSQQSIVNPPALNLVSDYQETDEFKEFIKLLRERPKFTPVDPSRFGVGEVPKRLDLEETPIIKELRLISEREHQKRQAAKSRVEWRKKGEKPDKKDYGGEAPKKKKKKKKPQAQGGGNPKKAFVPIYVEKK
jgi:hypothetical protein